MERYIAHALSFESGDTWRITGKPKSRKETPSPSSRASPTARKRKKGSWAAVGVGPPTAGGKSTGPRRKAGTATSNVTIKTLTQIFTLSTPFVRSGRLTPGRLCQAMHPGVSLKLRIFAVDNWSDDSSASHHSTMMDLNNARGYRGHRSRRCRLL